MKFNSCLDLAGGFLYQKFTISLNYLQYDENNYDYNGSEEKTYSLKFQINYSIYY